jgi:hypothetical protein
VKPKDSRNSGGASPPRATATGGASPPRATATGGAWVHAPPHKTPEKQGSATASSPLPVLAGVTCKTPKTQQAVDFSFSLLCFHICVSFSFSPFRICSSLQIGSFPFVSPFLFQVVGCMTKRAAGC